MSAPRVLFLTQSGELGGGERSLLDLAAQWPSEREVMVLADGPFVEALRARDVPTSIEPLGALASVKRESGAPGLGALTDVARLATRVAKAAKPMDVIHANSQKAFVVAAAAGLLARRPVVWHLRDILTTAHFSAANIRAAVMLANARAAAVIANSEATAEAFRAAGGNADLVQVVHNGIPAGRFDAVTVADAANARRALAPGAGCVVAAVSRLAPWKGQHVVIAATQTLPDVHAWIIGAPLFGEDDYAAKLRAQVKGLEVSDRVQLLGERHDVPTLLRAADIVVHSAVDAEPFGRVVVEGMLSRRPVIATSAGGVREIIRDGDTGVLVPPGDPVALAEAIRRVRAMPAALREVMVQRAYDDAVSRFSVEAMVSNVARVLSEAVSGRPRRT
ncbi:MAG: glycosyltransferase family 4 protein [Gemmatimonadaceae bacterium]|nr:glycosyltransferase family 4 protein [Gemmatimonadaceae bacterium]